MSRVVNLRSPRLRRAAAAVVSGALATVLAVPVAAQQLDTCSAQRGHDCVLDDWATGAQADVPSAFGDIEGIAWVEDEQGDAPEGGLDIQGVGIGRVTIDEPKAVRETSGLRKLGPLKKAVPRGPSLLVRVVLDRAPNQVPGGHASVHVATDVDGSRSNNVPAGIAAPDYPFAGSQDVYSLTWASTTGKTRVLYSDLAEAWYKGKDPFAAAWAAPGVLDLLIKPSAFGEGFRVVTHAAGGQGGYDVLALGPSAIPSDGRVGLAPVCIEGSIVAEPFAVSRLVENGQVVRDVEARASWLGGAVLPVTEVERQAIADLIAARTPDADSDPDPDAPEGRVRIPSWVNLFEDGIVIRQRADLRLALDGDHALLATELGLTRRGYNVLRDFEPDSTGVDVLDAWLERATDALRETTPPFRLNKRSGLLVGEGTGACVPWLANPSTPGAEASAAPAEPEAAASA